MTKTFLDNETWEYFWHPVCTVAELEASDKGRMRFRYEPPEGGRNAMDAAGNLAPLKYTDYTIQLPFGVTLDQPLGNGTRTVMWMYATPIDDINCRTFWFACTLLACGPVDTEMPGYRARDP